MLYAFFLFLLIVLICVWLFLLHQYIVNCEKGGRNIGIIILGLISVGFLLYYAFLRAHHGWTHGTMPDTLLVIIISSPVAWGLWIWRNKDKYMSYELEKEKLQHEQLIAYSENLYSLFNIIDDKGISINTRLTAISSIEPYLYGWKGKDFQVNSIEFFRNFLQTLSINKEFDINTNLRELLSRDEDRWRILKKIIDTFNKGLKNNCFNSPFSDFNFSCFIFDDIKFNVKFKNCIFHSAIFNNCICDASGIIDENKKYKEKQLKKSPDRLDNGYLMTDIFFERCDFYSVSFNQSSFSNINFVNCSFIRAIFDTMTKIELCQFSKQTDFKGASFCGSYIKNTIFGENSNFSDTNMGMVPLPTDRTKFQRNSQCVFIGCIWEQKCKFIGINIYESISFVYSNFYHSCVFYNIKYFLGKNSPAKFNLTGVKFFSPFISEKSLEYYSGHQKQDILQFSSFVFGHATIVITKHSNRKLVEIFSHIFNAEIQIDDKQLRTALYLSNKIYSYSQNNKVQIMGIHN